VKTSGFKGFKDISGKREVLGKISGKFRMLPTLVNIHILYTLLYKITHFYLLPTFIIIIKILKILGVVAP